MHVEFVSFFQYPLVAPALGAVGSGGEPNSVGPSTPKKHCRNFSRVRERWLDLLPKLSARAMRAYSGYTSKVVRGRVGAFEKYYQ